jgi:hypothetical protein
MYLTKMIGVYKIEGVMPLKRAEWRRIFAYASNHLSAIFAGSIQKRWSNFHVYRGIDFINR